MGIRNILITVADIEKSKKFYRELFGLEVVSDFGENVIMTERLVLQEKRAWEKGLKVDICPGNDFELFFEEGNFDSFLLKLRGRKDVEPVRDVYVNSWGRRCIMLKDPDGHLIEVGER